MIVLEVSHDVLIRWVYSSVAKNTVSPRLPKTTLTWSGLSTIGKTLSHGISTPAAHEVEAGFRKLENVGCRSDPGNGTRSCDCRDRKGQWTVVKGIWCPARLLRPGLQSRQQQENQTKGEREGE